MSSEARKQATAELYVFRYGRHSESDSVYGNTTDSRSPGLATRVATYTIFENNIPPGQIGISLALYDSGESESVRHKSETEMRLAHDGRARHANTNQGCCQ